MKLRTFLFFSVLFTVNALFAGKHKDLDKGIYARFVTSKGEIICQLDYQRVPMTVANFVGLAEGKFKVFDSIKIKKPLYDGLIFHRVIDNFMIQGGDPLGTGMGNPGYKFFDETDPELKHTGPGILSMANSGPNTNGSQFFITHVATPWLDGKHTVFGHVVKGQEVVDAIEQGDTMKQVEIIRIGWKAKRFKASKVFEKEYEKRKAEIEAAEAEHKRILGMSQDEYKDYMFDEVKKDFPDAQMTPSGLVYVVEKEGSSLRANDRDTLSVHYTGTMRKSGEKFDSSLDRGAPMVFQYKVNPMIPGFVEGMQLVGEGGKVRIFIPYFLAYGTRGRAPVIPPYTDLVFEIEMVDIGPAQP